jgi:hypothetical protein
MCFEDDGRRKGLCQLSPIYNCTVSENDLQVNMPDSNPPNPPQSTAWGLQLLKRVGLAGPSRPAQANWQNPSLTLPGYHRHLYKGYEYRELLDRPRTVKEGDPDKVWEAVPPVIRPTTPRRSPSVSRLPQPRIACSH